MTESESGYAVPVLRGLRATLIAMICALMLMPTLTLAPQLMFKGGPFGLIAVFIIAPLGGLWVGPFIAPLTAVLMLLILAAMVFGFAALARHDPAMRQRWLWALAGLVGGAVAGTALALEINTFGFAFPGTTISGGITGALCALLARRIMRV